MKPIRVSTCLCHFHVICICKPGSPIAPRLHRDEEPICPSEALEEQMGEPLRANPAPPDTLPWEKQHGPIAGCTVSFTHTPHVQHISCSVARQSCWIYRSTTDDLDQPLHPGKCLLPKFTMPDA
ncbi:hypothetical protein ABVT39_005832 [Epinephelus coioides]